MNTNPFKFGTIVDGPNFADRIEEQKKIKSFIKGDNHLILISPRRYGKTSLIKKIIHDTKTRHVYLDLQLITSPEDFAAQLLRRVYRIFPFEKMKDAIKSFQIIPSVSLNPVTGEIDVSFSKGSSQGITPLEDVLNAIEYHGTPANKILVVLDEFQEIFRIGSGMDRMLRSIMQVHQHVNYIFLGSSESLIREIFERKKSPFYHFGLLMTIDKIPASIFTPFIEDKLTALTLDAGKIAESIIDTTSSHPYYTQQLAFTVWELLKASGNSSNVVENAVTEIIYSHDNDYERLWNSFNRTDMKILIGMAESKMSPLTVEFSRVYGTGPLSTVFSSVKRLLQKGILIKSDKSYSIDDPFFSRWIINRRKM